MWSFDDKTEIVLHETYEQLGGNVQDRQWLVTSDWQIWILSDSFDRRWELQLGCAMTVDKNKPQQGRSLLFETLSKRTSLSFHLFFSLCQFNGTDWTRRSWSKKDAPVAIITSRNYLSRRSDASLSEDNANVDDTRDESCFDLFGSSGRISCR